MDCIAAANSQSRSQHDIAKDNHALARVLYSGAMIEFFTHFIGEPIKHYDFTWFRAIAPGKGTPAALRHCVYGPRRTAAALHRMDPHGRH